MNQRKLELEEKRAKLAAIREEKRRRNQQLTQQSASNSPSKISDAGDLIDRMAECLALYILSVASRATGGKSYP